MTYTVIADMHYLIGESETVLRTCNDLWMHLGIPGAAFVLFLNRKLRLVRDFATINNPLIQ